MLLIAEVWRGVLGSKLVSVRNEMFEVLDSVFYRLVGGKVMRRAHRRRGHRSSLVWIGAVGDSFQSSVRSLKLTAAPICRQRGC